MSRSKKLLAIIIFVTLLAAVIVGVSSAAKFYLGGAAQRSAAAVCGDQRGAQHVITISHGLASPDNVSARLCDELVIRNDDSTQRRLAFGAHSHHVDYDGADGRLVGRGEMISLVLTQKGEFSFHDHFDEAVHGHFSVE